MHVQEAKAQLDKAILDVDLELQNLTRTSAKLQKLLARRRATLEMSEKRLKVSDRWLELWCAAGREIRSIERHRVDVGTVQEAESGAHQ